MNTTIGVVAALPREARALLGRPCVKKADGFRHCRAMLSEKTGLLVVRSGMGIENAFAAAGWLTAKGVSVLGSFGVSGGLDPQLRTGDLVLADGVIQKEDQTKGIAPGSGSEMLTLGLWGGKERFYRGPILTVTEPVFDASRKKALFQQTKALAVDMESAAVARVAARGNLPFFAVRCVLDPQGLSIPKALYDCVDQQGRPRLGHLLRLILRNPPIIFFLIRMKRNMDAALACGPRIRRCLEEFSLTTPAP